MLTSYFDRLTATVHGYKRPSHLRGAVVKNTPDPGCLFPRKIIEKAFDAAKKRRDGKPTESALEALAFINERLDWTIYDVPIPPLELRHEFYGRFEWACRVLGEKPDEVRARGLPTVCGVGFARGSVWGMNSRRGRKIRDISVPARATLPGVAVDLVCQKSL